MTAETAIPEWIATGLLDELASLQTGQKVSKPITWAMSEREALQIGRAIISLTERSDLETCYRVHDADGVSIIWKRRKFAIKIGTELCAWREFVFRVMELEPGKALNIRFMFFETVDQTFKAHLRDSVLKDLKRHDEANRTDIIVSCINEEQLMFTIVALTERELAHAQE